MASIPVHQDIYKFERTYKGFTKRQITALASAAISAVLVVALLGYALGLSYTIAGTVGLVAAIPFVIAGFIPLAGMPADEAVLRMIDMNDRGTAFGWHGEECAPMKGETSREYKKKVKKRGAECLEN